MGVTEGNGHWNAGTKDEGEALNGLEIGFTIVAMAATAATAEGGGRRQGLIGIQMG